MQKGSTQKGSEVYTIGVLETRIGGQGLEKGMLRACEVLGLQLSPALNMRPWMSTKS